MQHVAKCVLRSPASCTFNFSACKLGQCLLFDWRTNRRSICTWSPGRPTQQAVELMQIHFSESWAMDLKTFLQDNQLTNEEIAVIDTRGTALPMQDGLDADLGELKDVPEPDRFPLRIWRKISKAGPSQADIWSPGQPVNWSTSRPANLPQYV